MHASIKTGLLAFGLLLGAAPALAAEPAPRRDLLNLSASASSEVTRDVLSIAFSTTKEGSDAAQVQAALRQALDVALAEARKVARPQQLELQTGNFALFPRYASKGGISGWQGTAELLVEGRDSAAIAQLSGRITSMSIARVGYSLSRDLREKAEGELGAQAIARFRAKAADYARQFGYSGYAIAEVSVSGDANPPMPIQPRARAVALMSSSADEALPVEAGRSTVNMSVSGTVLLTR